MSTLSVQLNNLLRSPMLDANGIVTWQWAKFFQGLAGPTTITATLASDGSISVNDYGIVTELIAPTIVPPSQSVVIGEYPTGVFNGVNDLFVLAHSPTSSMLALFQNGLRLSPGDDYSIFGTDITMVVPPIAGTKLVADYSY